MSEDARDPSPSDPLLPRLVGPRVTLRPGSDADAAELRAVLAEPSVTEWWGDPEPVDAVAAHLRGETDEHLLVVEVDGAVAGGIQYTEETTPMYRHAGIDVFLSSRAQGLGLGTEAVTLLARFLVDVRGHHRLTIDPAATNTRAIRCYTAVGFRPVGIMREYERGPDGSFHDGLLMDLLAADLVRSAAG